MPHIIPHCDTYFSASAYANSRSELLNTLETTIGDNLRSAKRLTDYFTAMLKQIQALGDPNQMTFIARPSLETEAEIEAYKTDIANGAVDRSGKAEYSSVDLSDEYVKLTAEQTNEFGSNLYEFLCNELGQSFASTHVDRFRRIASDASTGMLERGYSIGGYHLSIHDNGDLGITRRGETNGYGYGQKYNNQNTGNFDRYYEAGRIRQGRGSNDNESDNRLRQGRGAFAETGRSNTSDARENKSSSSRYSGHNTQSEVTAKAPDEGAFFDGKPMYSSADVEALTDEEAAGTNQYSSVDDEETLAFLNGQDTVKVYRAMQLVDGALHPPMSAKVNGKWRSTSYFGAWEQSDEDTSGLIFKKNKDGKEVGYYKLDKGNGSSLDARYNPYFHTSRSPLNDQFSSAYKRPNLVVVEGLVPLSELAGEYKAKYAKDSVGEISWHKGPVSSKLPKAKERLVILSRWFMPLRVVPDSEVAATVAGILEGENISVPYKVVTPSLRAAP